MDVIAILHFKDYTCIAYNYTSWAEFKKEISLSTNKKIVSRIERHSKCYIESMSTSCTIHHP